MIKDNNEFIEKKFTLLHKSATDITTNSVFINF